MCIRDRSAMPLEQSPVEPAGLVILAIRVVVTVLCATDLVAHGEHWRSDGEQQQSEEVPDLTVPELLDGGILGRSLYATVPARVVVGAVAVVLAIRLVAVSYTHLRAHE